VGSVDFVERGSRRDAEKLIEKNDSAAYRMAMIRDNISLPDD
jgi:hypothetical protein